jgi:GNAT superfamily N-acetyltransferase
MIDPDVRAAATDDVVALAGLEDAARAAVADQRGGARWLDEHGRIGDRWPAAVTAGGVFVAEIADADEGPGVVVGYLVAELRAAPMPIVMVDQVYVEPEARELGFGDALLAAAVEYGRANGAELIEAHTLPGDREIKNLYERAGVTARLITVSRAL